MRYTNAVLAGLPSSSMANSPLSWKIGLCQCGREMAGKHPAPAGIGQCHVCAFHGQGAGHSSMALQNIPNGTIASRNPPPGNGQGTVAARSTVGFKQYTKSLYLQCNSWGPGSSWEASGRSRKSPGSPQAVPLHLWDSVSSAVKLCVFRVMVVGLNLSWPSSSPFDNQQDSMHMIKLFSVFKIKL